MPKELFKRSPLAALKSMETGAEWSVMLGDCLNLLRALPNSSVSLVVTSPPYCMGKEYETSTSVEDFVCAHEALLPEIVRVTKPGGSICWQTGYHVRKNEVFPLDFAVFEIMSRISDVKLRNRIIWTYSHGLHATTRFSGRHETVLWFSKGATNVFDLDSIRIPQKYPGKKHYKGPKKGQFSGNPRGKNPGDVWDIPNVKGNHVEKTLHPCQFPVALAQRLIRALTMPGDVVLDPFLGSGSTGVAAMLEKRRFLGTEIDPSYINIATGRLADACNGRALVRPLDKPIFKPGPGLAVANSPIHFIREE